MNENIPYDRECLIDGCRQPIRLQRMDGGERWRVLHGFGGESARDYSPEELFVTSGYRAWVREVHAYEHAYEGATP